MIRYRTFQNWDPPALADIWRAQPSLAARMQPMIPALWEKLVLAKPYFERESLVLAVDGARPFGFVHAALGPSDDLSEVSSSHGTICELLTSPHERRSEASLELLSAGIDYLRRKGALAIYSGCQFPLNPFYVGLYGSSENGGWVESDARASDLYSALGFRPFRWRTHLRRMLTDYRPPVDRGLMQVRRKFQTIPPVEVLPDNWWECAVWSHASWQKFSLTVREGIEPIISAIFWVIEPLSKSWGARSAGLLRVEDTPEARDERLTTFLLAEALRSLSAEQQIFRVEAQVASQDASLLGVLAELGFEEYDRAALWRLE